ncbi:MAG: response regulator [Candidatus Omnitrophota bacterium]
MPKRKILVIDDEQDLANMLKIRLEANSYKAATANNGEDGLQKAKSYKPDLIILDIRMPNMDGLEVLRRLRGEPQTKTIPVIMLTGKGDSESIFKAEELGTPDYIRKPFEVEELLNCVRKCIGTGEDEGLKGWITQY